MRRYILSLLLLACAASAQDRTPVVLIEGWHLLCDSDLVSSSAFGQLEAKLRAERFPVYYFSPCSVRGKPPIELLGSELGAFIDRLGVPAVDLVTHSMGGLVGRAYLAGKSLTPGEFHPPRVVKVRKFVMIASPNFGALFGGALSDFAPDEQVRQMTPGSRFLFDLATWNQGHDDLRGVDALAIAGNGAGFLGLKGASDGLVPVTSASLNFARPDERTRILPYCHNDDALSTILGGGCSGTSLAKVDSDVHLTYRAIRSFLLDTDEWRSIGHTPSQDTFLSRYGGLLVGYKDRSGVPTRPPPNVTFSGGDLTRNEGAIYYREFLTGGTYELRSTSAEAPDSFRLSVPPGGYSALVVKPGPKIALATSAAARVDTLSLAPGMLISIYGSGFDASSVTVDGEPVPILYNAPAQINALLPSSFTDNYPLLTVSNSGGSDSVRFIVDGAVPAVFMIGDPALTLAAVIRENGTVMSPSNPARTGEVIATYATGLAGLQPIVTLGGVRAAVQYAGPAPGFPGLDQINLVTPEGIASPAALIISAGGHTSNVTRVYVAN